MSAVDFESWAAPDLQLTFRGRTYTVAPPSVADARKILAAAVRGEVNLGLVKGEIPEALGTAPATHATTMATTGGSGRSSSLSFPVLMMRGP